jgi:hypothetical protein
MYWFSVTWEFSWKREPSRKIWIQYLETPEPPSEAEYHLKVTVPSWR